MQRRLRSISAKTVSVALNYLTYFSIILASTMGPLYSELPMTEEAPSLRFTQTLQNYHSER